MVFDSSDGDSDDQEEAMIDAQSLTTKSSVADRKPSVRKRGPLIEELASHDFDNPEEESKDCEVGSAVLGKKRKFKDR